MMAAHEAQGGGTGSARRRRERRLRSMLRHERMTVAMALAERLHHSAQRPEMARVWGREMNYTATIRDPPTPQPELFELSFEEEPGGVRPDRLSEVRPQERDLRRTVDQIVDAVPEFPALDVPVSQMVDQPVVLLAAFDVLVPEQVIEVPKMSTPTRCPRTVLSVPQTAEQLVEAPNVVSLIDVIRHPLEQTVGGGRIGGLPGFLPGQSYSLSAEQIVDNPVPRRCFDGGLHGSHPGQSSSAFYGADHRVAAATAEQNVDIPVPRGAPHDFHQNPLPAAFQICWKQQIKGFLALFPGRKKVQRSRAPRGRNWARTSAHGLRELSWCLPVVSGTDGSTGFMGYDMG